MKSGMIAAEEAFEAITNEGHTSNTKGMYIQKMYMYHNII